MQLFALNEAKEWISAASALRQKDYTCPECNSRVRLRAGQFRHAHFFHLEEDRICRQNGKSQEHLQAQFQLQQMIPEIKLELSFPSIGRIADAAWEKEKIVFEIQCSPITSTELKARNKDYAKLGWKAVWIFHENRYNQRRLTAAEWAVRHESHYFTDIDQKGEGSFFSHRCIISQSLRAETILRKKITFTTPVRTGKRLYFLGDGWTEVLEGKNLLNQPLFYVKAFARRTLIVIKSILTMFLEKACR